MKKFLLVAIFVLFVPAIGLAQLDSFSLRPLSQGDLYKFVKVFSEMRGPLRVEIMKDQKTNFEKADPLSYVSKLKGDRDVEKVLKESGLNWSQFSELLGNVLMAYFSTQPDKTKAALLRQVYGYGLKLAPDQIPAEYQPMIEEFIKTEEGSQMAVMALDMILQIPPENKKLAEKEKRQLDQLFYTKFWKDKI